MNLNKTTPNLEIQDKANFEIQWRSIYSIWIQIMPFVFRKTKLQKPNHSDKSFIFMCIMNVYLSFKSSLIEFFTYLNPCLSRIVSEIAR